MYIVGIWRKCVMQVSLRTEAQPHVSSIALAGWLVADLTSPGSDDVRAIPNQTAGSMPDIAVKTVLKSPSPRHGEFNPVFTVRAPGGPVMESSAAPQHPHREASASSGAPARSRATPYRADSETPVVGGRD